MHHANIIINKGSCKDFVFDILEKDLNFNVKANPDFLLFENESFGIDDARDLALWTIGKPLVGEMKVSLLIIKSITPEAQNALLKVLEEPPPGTYIFINLESLGGILPTFLSRVRILDLIGISEKSDVSSSKDIGSKFLHSDIKEKFSIARSLSKKEDKNEMKELIKNFEEIAYKNNFKPTDLKNILTAKIFASTRGSSPKMLIEWLSCVI